MFFDSVLATLKAVIAGLALTAPNPPAAPTTLCTLQDSRITESSGVAVGTDALWTHNDSGDTARFFALDRHCRTLATYTLPGVKATDWEDTDRAGGYLWLADIGDNAGTRSQIQVHRVPEPRVTKGTHAVRPTTFRFRYEDGAHDAETLLVTPRTQQVFVVTKSYLGWSAIYAAPLRPSTTAVNVLRKVGSFEFMPSGTPGGPAGPAGQLSATAGDINADGTRVVVRTYTDAYEWVVNGDLAKVFSTTPTRTALPQDAQGEAIAYDTDGRSWITTSEGKGAAVRRIPR